MNDILNNITEKLNEVTELKHKDENWGQMDFLGPEIPVQWPCALVDLNGGSFSNIGKDIRATPNNRQEGTLTIEITIANLKLTNSSTRAPLSQKINAFSIWTVVKKVHEVLHGWKPVDGAGGMTRTTIAKVRRDDGIQEIRVNYTIGLHNC